MLTPLFTDGVWNTTFKIDLKEYCDFVRNNDTGRIISNNGGYQSNNLNLKEPTIQPLIQHIQTQTLKFSALFNCVDKSFKLDSMWININGYKDNNMEHMHSGCMFSGVYYVHTPEVCGNIEFIRSNGLHMEYEWKNKVNSYNTLNSAKWSLVAKQHKCYIFPSYYVHRVQSNFNPNEERYSISFNLSSNS